MDCFILKNKGDNVTEKFSITGMSCSACSSAVERGVQKLTGVHDAQVSLLTNSMTVVFDEKNVSPDSIISAVVALGYGAELINENKKKEKKSTNEIKNMKVRLIVSFSCLLPLMYISMGHMLGLPLPAFLAGVRNDVAFAFCQFLLTIPIMYVNRKYYIHGFKALFKGHPNMDTLVGVGSISAIAYGIFCIFKLSYALANGDMETANGVLHNLYFESGAMILTLITLGKFFEAKSKQKTSDAISKLVALTPDTALIEKDGKETRIKTSEIKVGDIVVIKTGNSIPVDGIVIQGTAAVNESAITGESLPVDKTVGQNVTSGTVNTNGYIKFKAEKVGSDTAIAKILHLVEEASASKAPIAKLADKVSGIFVPSVMVVSAVTFVSWLLIGKDFASALDLAIAVLVISCPCALGLATPTAIMVGTGKGASIGILIKNAESLETAHKTDVIVLDKTGTVTTGSPIVTDIIPIKGVSEFNLLSVAGSLEKLSEHPLSVAICKKAEEKNVLPIEATDYKNIPGEGISAKINEKIILGGNMKLMQNSNINVNELKAEYTDLASDGKTPLFFVNDGALLGIIAVADTIKPGAAAAVNEFKKLDMDVVMLTGDNEKTARYIAKQAGIETVIASVLPDGKEEIIKNFQKTGKIVAMVGDGINDAPALTRADVGIAIGAGTDVAIESADIVLIKSDLCDVSDAIKLSKAVIRNIKQNLFWAFFYNTLGIPLAAGLLLPVGIKLNPMIGAACMSISSVCVVANALRLRFWKSNNEMHPATQNIKPERIFKMTKTIYIDGMMCHHCTGRVDKVLNALEGVTAEVSLENKCAKLSLSKEYSDEELKNIVENEGYTVIEIK